MATCLVRGSLNIDEFFPVPHIVNAGETLSSTSQLTRRSGGKGANQAAAIALAGGKVELVGAVGTDGKWLKDGLRERGVGVDGVSVDETVSTGRAIIQLTPEGENAIVLYAGTNVIPLRSPSAHLVPPITHVLLQNEIDPETTKNFLRHAKSIGICTIYNPSPMLLPGEIHDFLWSTVDYLLINEHEAERLANGLDSSTPTEMVDHSDGQHHLDLISRLSIPQLSHTAIILTLGAQGVFAKLSQDEIYYLPAMRLQGEMRDTTGAGDCFTGYFVAGLLEEAQNDWRSLLRRCVVAAGMCVERPGAMESIPTRREVEARIASMDGS